MNHKPVFFEIAKAYATPPEERTGAQDMIAGLGLCWAFHCVAGFSITEQLALSEPGTYWWPTSYDFNHHRRYDFNHHRRYDFNHHRRYDFNHHRRYDFNHHRRYDFLRCTLALLFAAMSTKDFNEFLNGE